jgi:cysteinylglycine-S-conjugate dipeptidase
MNEGKLDLARYKALVTQLVANYGTVYEQDGLLKNRNTVCEMLTEAGFSLEHFKGEGVADVIVAQRPPVSREDWIGMYGHYDVEPLEEGWVTEPLVLTEVQERWFGRGLGDNLGPLAMRLLVAKDSMNSLNRPGIVWLLQGEEEIGSPFAHAVFPTLALPSVKFWLEETGYFNAVQGQRFLFKNMNEQLLELVSRLQAIAEAHKFTHYGEVRYMNKAFGESKCPYLNHIVKSEPYLAIGPNDDSSNIHAPNESLPMNTFEVCYAQYLEVMSRG